MNSSRRGSRVSRSIFAFLFVVSSVVTAQHAVLSGIIVDAASGDRLPAGTIRVVGSDRGTIANADGSYRLSLPHGTYRVAASFIGYRPDTVVIRAEGDVLADFRLEPSPIKMAEVIVSGEDPAMVIMRRVIEEKKQWQLKLETYRFEAFTRQVMRSDTAIAMISESYSSGFWRRGDTLREVVRQVRKTENIRMNQGVAAVGGIANFYDDEIAFGGYRFVGFTAPEAFDHYQFRLEKTLKREDATLFVIRLEPLSRITPLFYGTISVVDDRFVLASVDVKPNEAFLLPVITDFNISTRQQFAPMQERYWLPVDIHTRMDFGFDLGFIKLPRIDFEVTSSIYEYQVNVPVPDSLFVQRRIQRDSSIHRFDSTFWAEREVLPLTTEQAEAYKTLDSTQTLEKRFRPTGPLSGSDSSSFLKFLEYADLRFNRVQGGFVGGRYSVDTMGGVWSLQGSAGYGFSDHRWGLSGRVEALIDRDLRLRVGLEVFSGVRLIADQGKHTEFANIFTALFYKNDYFDYHSSTGARVWASVRPADKLDLRIDLRQEEHRPDSLRTNFSLTNRGRSYRPNPAVETGTLRSWGIMARWGGDPVPFNIIHSDQVMFNAEVSDRANLGGDFTYTRWELAWQYRVPTFYHRSPFGAYLGFYGSAGLSSGSLPVQRHFSLETQSSSFAPHGVLRGAQPREFAGDRYWQITAEHNFRSALFLWIGIPFLYKNGIETIVTATAANADHRRTLPVLGQSTPGTYVEAGFAIGKILKVMRLDLTYRFVRPTGLHVTLGISDLL